MTCPYCKTEISDQANTCPHCTKSLAFHKHPTISFILLGLGTASFAIWTIWLPFLAISLFVLGAFFVLIGIISVFIKKPIQ